jgi:hypothetical protein
MFLFPDRPSSKGQVVVVISDDKAGEVDKVGEIFITHELNEIGVFPLVRRG